MLLPIILLNFLAALEAHRHKRYLVYPDGGPARAQFILGLGIPVDLKEQAVTVGTVIKFQYDLPTNSTEYTSRIYGFANTVSRDMDGDQPNIEQDTAVDSRKIDSDAIEDEKLEDADEDRNDTLVDITFKERRKRALLYSEGGVIQGDDNELSLDEAIRRQELKDAKAREEDEEPQRMNRWDFYKIIEHMTERKFTLLLFLNVVSGSMISSEDQIKELDLRAKRQNREKLNLNFLCNFQYQYVQFQNISQLSQYYFIKQVSREQRDAELAARRDERLVNGMNGRECMLRAICEAAQFPVEEEGFVGELMHTRLWPITI
ncbi:hypothetical protein MSG28_012510 [Choristoneura fumiferana]|uniref:Uncharacterized protein n=1 Tax=Choristoneura fumiferana TaxID=7141 RepID=A0ACC0KDH4_CHOFU|nr:hypothetical protein MSG28_012510 [Choristoneura fumiferana]